MVQHIEGLDACLGGLEKNPMNSRVVPSLQKIGLIGFGQMGQGIAQVAAMNGYTVHLYDANDNVLRTGYKSIQDRLSKFYSRQNKGASAQANDQLVGAAMDRLIVSNRFEDAILDAGLVIEAVKEDRSVKADIFRELFTLKQLGDNAIIVTNTSSFLVGEFAALSSVLAPRIAGLHFFNPVDRMNLVEIVKTDKVDPAVIETLKKFVTSLQKSPVVCKDTPGFVVNQLLIPYLLESIRLVENDVASVQDVDTAMKLGAGYPMGPFELLDLVGLDTVKSVMDGWRAMEPNNPKFLPSFLLDSLVNNGNLGRKTGAGFYEYNTTTDATKAKI